MYKSPALWIALLLSPPIIAQEKIPDSTPADSSYRSAGRYHFPEDLTVLMADGQIKKVANIRPGDPVKCLKAGIVATTRVSEVAHTSEKASWVTALYLRPVDEQSASRDSWPLVPALLLEASPLLLVKTTEGSKTINQLKKGDILYRYEPATRQLSTWKVCVIHAKARRVLTLYSFFTEEGSFLPENRIALD